MASDSINSGKNLEPGYQYTGPLEGTGEVGPIIPVDAGSPMIMQDQITSMSLEPGQTKFQAPAPDNPNAPIPTKKAIRLQETRRAIQEESIRGGNRQTELARGEGEGASLRTAGAGGVRASGVSGAGGPGGPNEGHVNQWLKYPNVTSYLNMKLLNISDQESVGRHMDAMKVIGLGTDIFASGMENAQLSKLLKILAADKELLKAIGSFIQAGVALYQIGALAQARGQAREKVFGDASDETKAIKTQQDKINDLKNPTKMASENDQAFQQRVAASQDKAKIKKEEAQLDKLIKARDDEFQSLSQTNVSILDAKARMANAVVDGAIGLMSSFLTQTEGSLEKQKGINETVMQFLNRLADSASKAKDDQSSALDKILQLIVQQTSDLRVHASTRG